jgi:molecular chaperone Hsp33
MKPHPDSLQRFLFEQSHVRGELVHLDDAWRAVLERHDYPPDMQLLATEKVLKRAEMITDELAQ